MRVTGKPCGCPTCRPRPDIGYAKVWNDIWSTRVEIFARVANRHVDGSPCASPSDSSWYYWLAVLCGVTEESE